MKMSGHSLSVFISISSFCIFMLWFLTPIYCALFLAFTLTPVAHYVKGHPLKSIITLSVLAFSRHVVEPLLWKQRVQLPALVVLVILSSALMLFGIKGFLLIPLCFVAVAQLQLQSSN